LFEKSTRVLAQLSRLTDGRMPLIGVGGIDGPDAAYAKIRAGASAVQLYSALTWRGLSLVPEILSGLDAALARDGFGSVAQAVGTGRDAWL
jgi:dihydroorotate dehydrogenase